MIEDKDDLEMRILNLSEDKHVEGYTNTFEAHLTGILWPTCAKCPGAGTLCDEHKKLVEAALEAYSEAYSGAEATLSKTCQELAEETNEFVDKLVNEQKQAAALVAKRLTRAERRLVDMVAFDTSDLRVATRKVWKKLVKDGIFVNAVVTELTPLGELVLEALVDLAEPLRSSR